MRNATSISLFVLTLSLLTFGVLLGCTGTETIPGIPFTSSQWVSKLTNTDLNSFNNGSLDQKYLYVDWNRIGFKDINVSGGSNYSDVNTASYIASHDLNTSGVVKGSYIVGDGSLLTGLPPGYTDTNTRSVIASYDLNNTLQYLKNVPGLADVISAGYGGSTVIAKLQGIYNPNLAPPNDKLVINFVGGDLLDDSGNTTLNWKTMILGNGMFPILSWASNMLKFPQLTSNGFLKTSSGDGTVIVDTSDYITVQQADANYQPKGIASTYFLQETNSDILGYETLGTAPISTTSDTDCNLVKASTPPVLIDSYITALNNPDVNSIEAGTWEFDTYASVDSQVGVSSIDVNVFKRTSGGVETFLFSTNIGSISSNSFVLYSPLYTQLSSISLNRSDRIVVKYYARSTSPVDRNVCLSYGNSNYYSHIHTPIVVNAQNSGSQDLNSVLAKGNTTSVDINSTGNIYGANFYLPTNGKQYFGTSNNASQYYDGNNLWQNSREVGTGQNKFTGDVNVVDYNVVTNKSIVATGTGNVCVGTTSSCIYSDGSYMYVNPGSATEVKLMGGTVSAVGASNGNPAMIFYQGTTQRAFWQYLNFDQSFYLYTAGGIQMSFANTGIATFSKGLTTPKNVNADSNVTVGQRVIVGGHTYLYDDGTYGWLGRS